MVGLLHAMAFMVLLLIGWVIWNNKPLHYITLQEGLYFRSPRLATRFESDAANIAKVLVKALLNLIIKFNIQENEVVKNSEDHISSVFSLKIHRQIIKSALR